MNNLLNSISLYHDQAQRTANLAQNEGDKKRRRVLTDIAEHLYMLHDDLVVLGKLDHLPAILTPNSITAAGATATRPKR
jgi:hypothetical protein